MYNPPNTSQQITALRYQAIIIGYNYILDYIPIIIALHYQAKVQEKFVDISSSLPRFLGGKVGCRQAGQRVKVRVRVRVRVRVGIRGRVRVKDKATVMVTVMISDTVSEPISVTVLVTISVTVRVRVRVKVEAC